jgi:UDP-2,3-diacylglucosamine pyrophosphatase LpxH
MRAAHACQRSSLDLARRRLQIANGAARRDVRPRALSTRPLDTWSASCGVVDMERLVVLSDVHLGSDLNHVIAPILRSRGVDQDLVKMLQHYRTSTPPGDRLRLVFAGDLIDFVGMAVHAHAVHGLGNAADHVRVKLRMVLERHSDVFDALADLVAEGHVLDIVQGNHDLEFHWDTVKDELRSALLARANIRARRGAPDAMAFRQRITFYSWFLYLPGIAYIEHGHQYDAFCATDYVMAPLSPADPRRITRTVSDVLLRFVVRTTRGMHEYGHETNGVTHYLTFAAGHGPRGLLRLGASFASAVVELFRLHRGHLSRGAQGLRNEHERRMGLLAEASAIGMERLRSLAALQIPPVTRSIRDILASVLLDRIALGLAAVFALLVLAVVSILHAGHVGYAAPLLFLAWAVTHRHLARRRHADPASQMLERAAQLAKLFPAVFVVMGHTHTPARVALNDGASTYINVGSWAEEEADTEGLGRNAHRAARTHLVIHPTDHGPVAEFLAWGSDGPRPW